jgi:hypothetical protein
MEPDFYNGRVGFRYLLQTQSNEPRQPIAVPITLYDKQKGVGRCLLIYLACRHNGSDLLAGSNKITDLVRAILSDGSIIDLNACNSARMTSNIAKDLANLFPGVQVNGYAGYAVNFAALGIPVTAGFGSSERTLNIQSDISTPQKRQQVINQAQSFLREREALIRSVNVEVEVKNPFGAH